MSGALEVSRGSGGSGGSDALRVTGDSRGRALSEPTVEPEPAGSAGVAGHEGSGDAAGGVRGRWRLLAPALACWVAAACLVHAPGAARVLLVLLACVGIGVVASVFLRWKAASAASSNRASAGPAAHPGSRGARAQAAETRAPQARALGAMLLLCAALLLVCARVDASESFRADPGLRAAAEQRQPVRVTAELAGYPGTTRGFSGDTRGWVRATLRSVDGARLVGAVPATLWLPEHAPDDWGPGTQIAAAGTLTRGPPEGPSAYELRVSGASEGSCAAAKGATAPPGAADTRLGASADLCVPLTVCDWCGGVAALRRNAALLRVGLREAAAREPGAELVPGLAVGDTGLIGDALAEQMRESSLTHLTAVSGANCALVVTGVRWLAVRLGAGRRIRMLCSGAGLVGFAVVVGPDASVLRASIMAAVLLISGFGGRRAQALPSLGLAVLLLLALDPWQAVQPGFALSVTATGGILLLATPLESWCRDRMRVPRIVALPFAVTAVAQLACAPLLLLLQPGLPVGGVLANLLAAPAAPAGTALGMGAMLTIPVHAPTGTALVWLATWPARWIEAAGALGSALPAGRWHWPGGWGGAVLLALVYACLFLARIRGTARGTGLRPWARAEAAPWRGSALARSFAGAAAGVLVAVTIAVPVAVRAGVPRDWVVVACDVGQGDAILLRDPKMPDHVMLVDTGEDPAALTACLSLFGVTRVDTLVLTHDHRDHVGALSAIADRTELAIVAGTSQAQTDEPALAERVSRQGIRTLPAAAGLTGAVPAGTASGLRWEVLAPEAEATPAEPNASSLVLLVEVTGHRVLLLGDTGEAQQLPLLREHPGLTADVVKVAHHGSRDQAPALYRALGASLALVSVGAENRYGHPNPELLGDLADAGAQALRTDELGSIALVPRGDALEPWAAGERGTMVGEGRW